MYKVLSSTCVAACEGLEKCKGYVTDGEQALDAAFKKDFPKAKHLRCVKHFQENCNAQLHKIGIRDKKTQKFFLENVFGVRGKCEGIIDAEDKHEVKGQLQSFKDVFDKKEVEVLKKRGDYQPRFSLYLENNRENDRKEDDAEMPPRSWYAK